MMQKRLVLALIVASVLVATEATFLRASGDSTPIYMKAPKSAIEKEKARAILGVARGEALAALYNVNVKHNDSKHIALRVERLALEKVKDSELLAEEFDKNISAATDEDNVNDPVTGESRKMKWMDKRDDEKAEATFYGQIADNAKVVLGDANKGLKRVVITRGLVNAEMDDIENLALPMRKELDYAEEVHTDAMMLWQQWNNSARDYTCLPVPAVSNVQQICADGNTKFGIKCGIECIPGYDSPGESTNTLRCRKEGKFGKELYGEWKGMAACVGRMCGKPAPIDKAKTVVQMIRFPNAAQYTCYEGYSQNGSANGPKTFPVPCDKVGNFDQDPTHQCERIKCGKAPAVIYTEPIPGKFAFSDSITYKCLVGYTLDETPGGLTTFSTSCQATGRFTQAQKCKAVRCGPANDFDDTDLVTKGGTNGGDEYYYDDVTEYKCHDGYSTDQKASGPKTFSLRCSEKGDFVVKGDGKTTIPQCRPVSAGQSPEVVHGNAKAREMFYGDSVTVTADTGYTTEGKPTEGLSFVLSVTTKGTFDGLKEFVPVICGPTPSVEKATTTFTAAKAVYGDVLAYNCEDGFSTDETAGQSSKSFSIQCEADADLSKVPDFGYCANIDDCAEHTCGPHGACVDHLNNYTCACQSGYEQTYDNNTDELMCGNIDDCGPEACGVGECKDLVNGYDCTCPKGFEVIGDAEEKTCKAKVCGNPPVVAMAHTSPVEDADLKKSYNDQVQYACDYGHVLKGNNGRAPGKNHFSISCKANRKFTSRKQCRPINCFEAPKVDFATRNSKTATFSESVRYTCRNGYTVDGTPTGDRSFGVNCLVSGSYSEVSKCRPVNCGVPDDVPNANRPAGSLVFKKSATYKCFEGYTLDGKKNGPTQFTVKCRADGTLDKLAACLPKVCGSPPSSIHALHASTQDEGLIRYPRSTEVTCRDGYTVGGSPTGNQSFLVHCESSGSFDDHDHKACDPVRCGTPPDMVNAKLDRVRSPHNPDHNPQDKEILNYDETAIYKCLVGFTAGGEPDAPKTIKAECLPSGEFSTPPLDMQCRNVDDCEKHSCGPEGTCVDEIGASPAYTCDCVYGFELVTKANGEKTCGNTDDCKDQSCGVGVCKDLVGDYTCVCPTGYYIGVQDGAKTCVPVTCTETTPSLTNGKQQSSHSGAIVFPTTLRYKCNTGYSIDGSVASSKRKFQVHCKPVGQLAGLMECQKITCGTPRMLPFTKLISPATPRRSIEYEEVVKYECFDGYTVGGKSDGATEFTVECPDDGHLTDPKVCEPVKCGTAPPVPKSRAGISGDVFFGMNLEYSCDLGYTLDATRQGLVSFQRQCKKSGAFTDVSSAQPCRPISGGAAPTLANAVMSEYAGKPVTSFPPAIQYPDGLEYRCAAGFSENGSPSGPTKISARVNTMGTLSPALPSGCLEITYTIRGKVKNALNGQPLQGASVRIDGTSNVAQTSNGFFTLSGVKPGSVDLVYERNTYITSKRTMVISQDVNTGGSADVSMSPVMEDDQWRVVVKWDRNPGDLDSYAKWGWSKVCWYGRTRRSMGMKGVLEVDDTNGYGPETVYLTGVGNCRGGSYYCDIKYMINDYSRSGRMKDISKAEVTLYTGTSVAGNWKIGNCHNSVSADGNWWHVFTLDGESNTLKWKCDQPASSSASSSMIQHSSNQDPPKAVDYDSYKGPFPGRFFRHSMHHATPLKGSNSSHMVAAPSANATAGAPAGKAHSNLKAKAAALLQGQKRPFLQAHM